MVQVFRLVDPGRVDRVIAFDELPENIMRGITRGSANGLPKSWHDYLGVKKGDDKALPFYVLDFRTLNRDKEKWQEIGNYVRRSTDKEVRLLDNLYDMAKQMSTDSYSSLELDPDDITIIPILREKEEIKPIEQVKVEPKIEVKKEANPFENPPPLVKKRLGRPKKEPVAVQ